MPRLAIFGLGAVAQQIHLPACALLPTVKIVGACEPNRDRRQYVGRRLGIRALYTEPETLLKEEKPDIVIIAAPPDLHRDLCLLALGHGAHVFCEKPFVRTVAEADEVIETAERVQRTVVVNNQYRFMEIYRGPQEKLAAGVYGEPFLIQCWQQMLHHPKEEKNWRSQLARYTLYEFGTHPLDLICFFFGDLPLSINAHTPRIPHGLETDVVVQATLRFPRDRLATLMFNRVTHAPARYLETRIDCEKASLRISFGGIARASVEWSSAAKRPVTRFSVVRGGEARVEAGGKSRVIAREWNEGRARATSLNLKGLIEAQNNGRATLDHAKHARELLRVVLAGYESARTGETVWLRPGT